MIWCYDIRIIMWQFTFIINLARIYMIRLLFILIFFLMGEKKRFYQRRYKKSPPQLTPHTFIIDKLPLIEKRQPLDYKKLLEEYNLLHGKQLTPVKRRKNSTNVDPAIRCIWCIVGLSLYYYMNLGLSARQTRQALKELYDVAISHQTILNYIEAAAYRLTPLTENTSIHIEGDFVTDETYITIQGNWGYVIFTYVPHKNIITTQHVCLQRDVQAAWTSLLNHLSQIDPRLLTDPIIHLLWITDGNPIYKLAHQYGLHFQHKLVIGLKNSDPESFEYRVFKQFIERLNRTYKEKYRKTCGFKSFNGAVVFTTLFVIWFNYLKPKMPNLTNDPPERLELEKLTFGPEKWLKLLELAQNN